MGSCVLGYQSDGNGKLGYVVVAREFAMGNSIIKLNDSKLQAILLHEILHAFGMRHPKMNDLPDGYCSTITHGSDCNPRNVVDMIFLFLQLARAYDVNVNLNCPNPELQDGKEATPNQKNNSQKVTFPAINIILSIFGGASLCSFYMMCSNGRDQAEIEEAGVDEQPVFDPNESDQLLRDQLLKELQDFLDERSRGFVQEVMAKAVKEASVLKI